MSSPHPPPYGPPPQPPYPPGAHDGPRYPPPIGSPPPVRKKSGKGCTIAVIVVMVLMAGSFVAVGVGIHWMGDKVTEAVGTTRPCPYITDVEASALVGTDAEATLFTGALGRVLNITDIRVLPDKESCIIQQRGDDDGASMPGLGRAVKYVGADAAALYDAELTTAKGVTVNRGGGATVETQPYFNKAVPGLGDEAFCTKSTYTLAGVLARHGDTLVYVAVVRADSQPGVDPSRTKLTTDDPACDVSTDLARSILAGG